MQFTDLPIEVLDKIFSDIHSLTNVATDIRFHWYRYLKCLTVLRFLQLTELERIKTNQLSYYINFDSKRLQTKSNKFLVLCYEDVLPNVNFQTVVVLTYAQIWPGSEIYIGFWRLYLFLYPFFLDTWNHLNGNELRLSDVPSLKPTWPLFSDFHRRNIQSIIEENTYLQQKTIFITRKSIFERMENVYLHLCPDSLREFSKIEQFFNPISLSIKIIPDASQSIIRQLSGYKFPNLEAFLLEYVGANSHVDIEAILFLFDLDKIKRLSLRVSFLNVIELLWRLKHRRHDSFTLTTSVLTFGRVGLCTSSNIAKLLKMKFSKYTVYTTDETTSVSQPRISHTDNVLTPFQQRNIYRSYY